MSETGTVEPPCEQDPEPAITASARTPDHPSDAHTKTAASPSSTAEPAAENFEGQAIEENAEEFLKKLPPEIGTLLMMIGVAGVFLPGVVGTPLLIAGAVVVWPKTFEPLERKFAKMCPGPHREGLKQIKRFIHDMNRRFPDS